MPSARTTPEKTIARIAAGNANCKLTTFIISPSRLALRVVAEHAEDLVHHHIQNLKGPPSVDEGCVVVSGASSGSLVYVIDRAVKLVVVGVRYTNPAIEPRPYLGTTFAEWQIG